MVEYPLLITSVLSTYAENSNKHKSFDSRKHETISAINKIVSLGIFNKIVIVDGSNNIILNQIEVEYYKSKLILIEQLSFQQNKFDVSKFGKSYGEIEIVNFAVENSKIINSSNGFYKISGRYFIKNLNKIISKIDRYENVFFLDNPLFINKNREYVATIFYKVTNEFYTKNLSQLMYKCNSSKKGFLEHIYYNALHKFRRNSILVGFPFYDAISGTTGKKAVNRFFIFRNLLSELGYLCFQYK
jgi:hypothetical protein